MEGETEVVVVDVFYQASDEGIHEVMAILEKM